MIEYLHLAIRTTTDSDTEIAAKIKDDLGASVTTGCVLVVESETETIITVNGDYDSTNEVWSFIIPKETYIDLDRKRYFYSIKQDGNSLNFKQPLYLV